jgi:hypothetical protein
LKAAGITNPTPQDIYMAHQQGAHGWTDIKESLASGIPVSPSIKRNMINNAPPSLRNRVEKRTDSSGKPYFALKPGQTMNEQEWAEGWNSKLESMGPALNVLPAPQPMNNSALSRGVTDSNKPQPPIIIPSPPQPERRSDAGGSVMVAQSKVDDPSIWGMMSIGNLGG